MTCVRIETSHFPSFRFDLKDAKTQRCPLKKMSIVKAGNSHLFFWKSKALNLDSMPLWVLALLMLDPPAVERCFGRPGWLRGMAILRLSTAFLPRTVISDVASRLAPPRLMQLGASPDTSNILEATRSVTLFPVQLHTHQQDTTRGKCRNTTNIFGTSSA